MRSETLFEEMKRYVRFGPADAANLAEFGAVAASHFARIAAEFYERTREHEGAHAVFRDEAQIERLQRTMVAWMQRLCAGPHDEGYFQERARIGRMHVSIGLPQHYMFTAMSLIRGEFERIADELPRERAAGLRRSLGKILDLELAIMLETYRQNLEEKLERRERLERVQLQRALARSERRYANAMQLAHVLVVGVDAAGRIMLFNHEAERVTGRGWEEATGQSFVELLLPEEVRADEGRRFLDAAAGRAAPPHGWEVPVLTRAGRWRTIRWQLGYVPSNPDDDVALFAIGQDVTEEHDLHERTARSEKLAAVGTLAAGLAHEIRNPLNGALLHVTFLERALKKHGGDADSLAAVQFVGDEIRRLSALVTDFLVFARPTAPQLKPESVREVCQRAANLVAGDAAVAKATLTVQPPPADLVVELDPQKIEQVLLNLLRNAIDAVGSTGGGRVFLRSRRVPRGVVFEVEDEGPGLPHPDAPIYDAFYSTKPNGTGLGLAIVHRAVTDHGGKIDVESRPGRTVFRVTLPMLEQSRPIAEEP